MKCFSLRSAAVLALALAVALAGGASQIEAQGKGTIKIATQSPLSGGQAALGEGIKLGTQLAVEKFKGNLEKAGFRVELVPYDDQAKPDVGVANAKNIIADKNIMVVIGHLNSGVAIPSSEAFKNDLEKKGVKIIGFEGTEEKSNFDPIITPIKAKNPDLVYFGGIYDQGAPFFKQAREKGVKAKFLGPDGMDSSDFVKIGGKVVVGTYYTTAAAPASSPQAKQFGEEFKKKYGKNPEPYAAESYVATAIAIKALEDVTKGGKAPTREAVAAAIRKVKYNGMTGTIEFDDKGDPKKASYYVMQVSSDNPEKWSENKEAKRLAIAAPAMKK